MSELLKQIKFYPNVFDPKVLHDMYKRANRSSAWGFQCSGDPKIEKEENKYKFLVLNIPSDIPEILSLLDIIQNTTGEKFKIDRVYINAQYFGMPGKPHRDSPLPNKYTFLVYMNPEWNCTLGGQTVFLDEYVDTNTREQIKLSDEVIVKFPEFNCGILFPANIYHYAEAPTKDFYDFRMTLAFKLEKRE